MVATMPFEVLRGVYLGILTGVVPALIAFGLGFTFRYVTGVSIPAFAVVVLGLALAGVNGGLLALADPAITQQANSVTLVTAVVVVLMITLYTHAKGDQLGSEAPRRLSWKQLRDRTVSREVVELVGGFGQVRIEVVGEIRDMEGYPPVPDQLRTDLQAVDWQFPADLTLAELQTRMEERLRSEFDLQDVAVAIDEQGRASITAAPPSAGVSNRVDPGKRAVSISALIPTGVARGDECTILAGDTVVDGTVVSARSGPATEASKPEPVEAAAEGEDDTPIRQPTTRAPTTTGGEGRITIAVSPSDAEALLGASEGRVVITSRGTRREFELVSMLRQSGQRIERVTIGADGPLAGDTLAHASVRDTYGVAILAHRQDGQWRMAPRGETTLAGGEEVFVVGSGPSLRGFREAVA